MYIANVIDHATYRHLTKPTSLAKHRATSLRDNLSPPEQLLWSYLRNNQIADLPFRSQHPLGPYIADFYCRDARLVIEIDGKTHQADQLTHDKMRDEWMQSCDIHVLRVQAHEVFAELNAVIQTIRSIALKRAQDIKEHKPRSSVPPRAPRGGGSAQGGVGGVFRATHASANMPNQSQTEALPIVPPRALAGRWAWAKPKVGGVFRATHASANMPNQ